VLEYCVTTWIVRNCTNYKKVTSWSPTYKLSNKPTIPSSHNKRRANCWNCDKNKTICDNLSHFRMYETQIEYHAREMSYLVFCQVDLGDELKWYAFLTALQSIHDKIINIRAPMRLWNCPLMSGDFLLRKCYHWNYLWVHFWRIQGQSIMIRRLWSYEVDHGEIKMVLSDMGVALCSSYVNSILHYDLTIKGAIIESLDTQGLDFHETRLYNFVIFKTKIECCKLQFRWLVWLVDDHNFSLSFCIHSLIWNRKPRITDSTI
jgi:hypothetical protein